MEIKDKIKTIKTKWTVRFGGEAKVMVKIGDEVVMSQVLVSSSRYEETSKSVSLFFPGVRGNDLVKLKNLLIGLSIEEGKVIGGENGVVGKRVVSNITGQIEKIDEFDNLIIRKNKKKVDEVLSPCEAKVVEIDETSLILEFRTMEYVGVAIKEGKCWGKGLKEVVKINDLSVADFGKLILIPILDGATLAKAEVVGVTGVIVSNSDDVSIKSDKINTNLPILALEKKLYEQLKESKDFENRRGLLNVANGRLLLVI